MVFQSNLKPTIHCRSSGLYNSSFYFTTGVSSTIQNNVCYD